MKRLFWLAALGACTEYEFIEGDDVGAGADTDLPGPGGDGGDGGDGGRPPGEGDCGDFGPGLDYAVDADPDCLREPTVGSFSPVVEWRHGENPLIPGYDQNMSTPMVANLTDDDGDGVIDDRDIPDIVFTSYVGSDYGSPGTLTAISGDGSGLHWSITDAGGYRVYGSGGVAVGDLEGDGRPEICVASPDAALLCLDGPSGAYRWAAGGELNAYGHPAIADMDGDGAAEVIFGRQIFNAGGALLGQGAGGTGGGVYMSFAVDWDGDGQLEVMAGNTVYEMDGSTSWSDGRADGHPAVGDFDGDGRPDVVRSGGSYVSVALNDGSLLWESALPGGGGGAPTVADFDGDGLPEVGVAGLSYYSMFDTDGQVIWSNPTEDDSSSVTGSSVFDFEGDGTAEVVYADEHNLYVYDGATGAVLLMNDGHASGTLYEYPVIADVDGDGATEIIVSSNDMWWEGWNGVTVIGDADDSWTPARPIWNQFAYHITNINNDATIPAVQTENWLSWNNFRAGGNEYGPSHWMVDVQPVDAEVCTDECDAGRALVTVAVENEGLLPASPVVVSLRVGSEAGPEVARESVSWLDAGGGAWTAVITVASEDWSGPLFAVVDADGALLECDEGDNVFALGGWPCP